MIFPVRSGLSRDCTVNLSPKVKCLGPHSKNTRSYKQASTPAPFGAAIFMASGDARCHLRRPSRLRTILQRIPESLHTFRPVFFCDFHRRFPVLVAYLQVRSMLDVQPKMASSDTAVKIGVSPFLLQAFTSAPSFSNSSSTALRGRCSAVLPSSSLAFTSAPAFTNGADALGLVSRRSAVVSICGGDHGCRAPLVPGLQVWVIPQDLRHNFRIS